jgi:hypothetical protein
MNVLFCLDRIKYVEKRNMLRTEAVNRSAALFCVLYETLMIRFEETLLHRVDPFDKKRCYFPSWASFISDL